MSELAEINEQIKAEHAKLAEAEEAARLERVAEREAARLGAARAELAAVKSQTAQLRKSATPPPPVRPAPSGNIEE